MLRLSSVSQSAPVFKSVCHRLHAPCIFNLLATQQYWRVGSKNFWADLKKEVSIEETDRTCTTNTLQTNCWPKKYLLINVIHVGYAIQIFYSSQKEPWKVYSYCKNSFDAYDYWRGHLSFHNPSCSPQFSASTSRVYNVQRTAKCPDVKNL